MESLAQTHSEISAEDSEDIPENSNEKESKSVEEEMSDSEES